MSDNAQESNLAAEIDAWVDQVETTGGDSSTGETSAEPVTGDVSPSPEEAAEAAVAARQEGDIDAFLAELEGESQAQENNEPIGAGDESAGDEGLETSNDDSTADEAEDEEDVAEKPEDTPADKRRKGRARKQRERMKAAEARVQEYDEIVPKVIENAEWFAESYFQKTGELENLAAENARLRERLEMYSVPEYESETHQRMVEVERQNRALLQEKEAREQARRSHISQQRQAQVSADANEIRSLAPKIGVSEVALAKAVVARRAIDPTEAVLDIAKDIARTNNKKSRASAAKRQAAANGNAPKKARGGSAGVSESKQYDHNNVDDMMAYMRDLGYEGY